MKPERKQARSEGVSEVSQWLYDLGVKPGGFYLETKARVEHAMRDRDWPEKQRVWACLALATMGFNQQLAVKSERGKLVPLTQTDISHQTGIEVKNVHRAVLELEGEGFLAREPFDPKHGLCKGEVKILCYAIPRRPKKSKSESAPAEKRNYDGLPDEVAYWLRHLKLGIPDAEKLEEARTLALELSARVDRLREICRLEPSQMSIPEVVNPDKVAELTESSGPRVVELGPARGGQKEPLGLRAGQNGVGAQGSLNRKKDIKRLTTIAAAAKGSGETPPPQTTTELQTLKTELARWIVIDDAAVERLWSECRAGCFDCTENEVATFCASKRPGLKTARNPVAVLLASVPSFFANGGSAALMEWRQQAQRAYESEQQRLKDTARNILDPEYAGAGWSDKEIAWAKEILGVG